MEELVDDFSLERVGKSGSRYNFEKTKWFNQQHIRLKSAKQILKNIKFPENKNEDYLLKVVDLVKERCVFYKDFINESTYLFSPPETYEKEAVQKKWSIESVGHLLSIKTKLSLCDDFSKENLETIFKNYLKSSNIGFGKAMPGLQNIYNRKDAGSIDVFNYVRPVKAWGSGGGEAPEWNRQMVGCVCVCVISRLPSEKKSAGFIKRYFMDADFQVGAGFTDKKKKRRLGLDMM